jgi:hypothetical protein
MDAQRLIEEQREKGYSLAAKLETAWIKVCVCVICHL